MKCSQKLLSIAAQVLITLMLLYSIALAMDVDVTKPWHYLSQIAKSRFDLTSIDSDENGRIDAGIIEDTLQDITNNGATTTHTINVGGLNSAGAIISSGTLNIGSGKLFVDVSTGRVGIGTASPTAKLDVRGDVKISGSITGSGNLNIGSGKLFVDVSTGRVGISTTSPHGKLGIKQGHGDWITLERTAGSGYWHIHNPSTQERIEIGYTSDSGTTRWGMFVIKNNGNVGIGTTSPTAKLDVAGYIKSNTGFCIGSECITSWPSGDEIRKILVYNKAGTYSYTIPSGVSKAHIRVWGAGGGGTDGGCDCMGAPGGAGGYAEGIYDVSPGDTLTIIVGAGGSGGGDAAGANAGIEHSGQSGGSSEVRRNGVTLLGATGGGGGKPQGSWFNCPGSAGKDGCGYGGNLLNLCGKDGTSPFGGGPGANKWVGEWPGGGGRGGQGGISYDEWCNGESGARGADGGVVIVLY